MSSTTFIVFKDKLGAKITHTITQTRYVWLNIIRILNIASLLIVVAASIATITRTFIVSKFFFFDAATQIIRALIAVFLIATETPWFVAYFTREWACFGNNHGFSMLSCAMTCLGVNILGDLNYLHIQIQGPYGILLTSAVRDISAEIVLKANQLVKSVIRGLM
ncbi:hypothetical protein H2200_012440 [Cladophialophora chaetospira]|uniref:DUF7598 domain-containing protein n=1 Tax=Cladophialophora chaetospira TaxID=386627 RepID=A0AA38WXU9_9EURO|nr:hypothetical protein H2200_012440 [Cladophialophora chaetospira]